MKLRKSLSLLLALTLLFVCCGNALPTAFAETGTPTITVSAETAEPGQSVVVTVSILNNPGITTALISLHYSEGLTLENVEDTQLLKDPVFSKEYSQNPFILYWDNSLASINNTKNGILVRLQFRVSSTASAGNYRIWITYNAEEIFNTQLENRIFELVDGGITVSCKHIFGSYTSDHNATCTEDGTKTASCTLCGASDTIPDAGSALGHDFSAWTQTLAPTCTADGTQTRTCSRCGKTESEPISALGHSFINGVCTVCGIKDSSVPTESVITKAFDDVKHYDWFYAAVNFVVGKGLMDGVGNNKFNPNGTMTRAMLVTVLWRYEGEPAGTSNHFSDVPAGQWYSEAVSWAADNEIVKGMSATAFQPSGNVTREQLAAIMFRYCVKKGIDTSARDSLADFPDAGRVSSWAADAVKWAVASGLISGSEGMLDPRGNATRAQVATILKRFLENVAI